MNSVEMDAGPRASGVSLVKPFAGLLAPFSPA
jgi:hypothetical protein